ncbi:hypothetical protein JHS3_22510 [Jeongeupia sp. HS-3]|uniref:restriction endonuclease subunit S n=1 Tax=Jeongeupia sp. HS-3 TaxID=1009682 RepID=UPI0018A6A3BB|nr:restriction endonuclease subunit S [Jeongeupia sp. HS-3]BCL76515.1 hypothetical protein JHS3_22510 [Jeongeupia sp. HS-3]
MSLPRYGEYKGSGLDWLGHVPAHWSIKRLRFVAELNPSKSELAGIDRATEVSFLPMEAIGDDGSTRGLNPDAPMKDSGVTWLGEVPAHWDVAALKRYWSVTDCKHVTAEFVDEGYPLASIREVQSKYVSLDAAKRTTQLFYEQLIEGGRRPLPSDLIFSRNATVGEVAQVDEGHPPFAMGQDVCLLRRLNDDSSSDFMQSVIRSGVVVEQLKNIMVGSTFKRVNVEDIRALQVPVPPPKEQVQLAELIVDESNRLDALEAEAECAISLLKERRSALIAAAVTGQIDVRSTVELA